MVQISMEMTESDFDRLVTVSIKWAGEGVPDWDGPDWRTHAVGGRFELLDGDPLGLPGLHWRWAFWVERWADVMLARAFLAAAGSECEVVWDLVEPGQYVLLSDYTTASWAAAHEAGAEHRAAEERAVAQAAGRAHLRSASNE